MPRRLIQAFRRIYAPNTPAGVVSALNTAVAPALQVLGVWPSRAADDMLSVPGAVIYGPNVSPEFRRAHQQGIATHGPSAMALAALRNPPPFTFSEFRHREQPSGTNLWIFELLKDHNIVDGLYSSFGSWLVVYSSAVMLKGRALTLEQRRVFTIMGADAVERLKELNELKNRGRAKCQIAELTALAPTEVMAMRHLTQGQEIAAIAAAMGQSPNSVRSYIRRARQKLHAKNRLHAAIIAERNRLLV